MPWSNLDKDIQLKAVDQIILLSYQEINLQLSTALRAAAQELEFRHGKDEKDILSDFVDRGKSVPDLGAQEIIKNNETTRKIVTFIFSIVGIICGAFIAIHNFYVPYIYNMGAIVISTLLFGTIGFFISSRIK